MPEAYKRLATNLALSFSDVQTVNSPLERYPRLLILPRAEIGWPQESGEGPTLGDRSLQLFLPGLARYEMPLLQERIQSSGAQPLPDELNGLKIRFMVAQIDIIELHQLHHTPRQNYWLR